MKNGFNRACLFLLGITLAAGCGPAPEDMKPEVSEDTDPGASEIASPETVHAQSFLGDLGTRTGVPVETYAYISTASNQYSVGCNVGSSRDISWVWTVPSSGTYAFGTSGSNFDTVLQIRNYNTSAVLGCNDDRDTSTRASRVTLSGLVSGTRLLIIIEGYNGQYGNYAQLNIVKN